MDYKIISDQAPEWWDTYHQESELNSGFCQTSTWSRLHADVNNVVPVFVHSEDIRIASLCFYNKAPNFFKGLMSYISPRGSLDIFEGPVIRDHSELESTLSSFLKNIELFAKSKKLKAIRIHNLGIFSQTYTKNPRLKEMLLKEGYNLQPWQTSLIDLEIKDELLLQSFDYSIRKSINSCKKKGVRILRCITQQDFEELFLRNYFLATKDEKALFETKLKLMWLYDKGKHYEFFVAIDDQEQVLATLGTYEFNRCVTEIMSARTTRAKETKSSAQDLLHYEIIKYHQEKGNKYFNLAGFNPSPANPKEEGIKNYKLKWNGEIVNYYSAEKIL